MIFVTESADVIADAVMALQTRKPLRTPVTLAAGAKIARGRVLRVRNLRDGPNGQRRVEIETDDA